MFPKKTFFAPPLKVKEEYDTNEKEISAGENHSSPQEQCCDSNTTNSLIVEDKSNLPLQELSCQTKSEVNEPTTDQNEVTNKAQVLQDSAVSTSSDVEISKSPKAFDRKMASPYRNKNIDPLAVVVPLIGKKTEFGNAQIPFRRDLAEMIKKQNAIVDNDPALKERMGMSYHDWRKMRDAKPKEEKEREERMQKLLDLRIARWITNIAVKILEQLSLEEPDEDKVVQLFVRFLDSYPSPRSLLYSPHFIHVVMLCRANSNFGREVQTVANECFYRCHALFPIPEGYNFETVFTSDCVKYVPETFDRMLDVHLDYGDYDWSGESDDNGYDTASESAMGD